MRINLENLDMRIPSWIQPTLLALVLVCSASHAALVTLNGDNVTFEYDDATLFGAAFVVGDSIFFTPTDFKNESLDGITAPLVTDMLNIRITAMPGKTIAMDSITTQEFGDYILDDGPGNAGGASVSASLRTQVLSLTNFGAPSIELVQTGLITAPQDGSTNNWSLTNVNDWAWDDETDLIFQIQNNLIADTNNLGERAFIQKKAVPIGIVVEVIPAVPVPAAAWLFGSALLGLIMVRRPHNT